MRRLNAPRSRDAIRNIPLREPPITELSPSFGHASGTFRVFLCCRDDNFFSFLHPAVFRIPEVAETLIRYRRPLSRGFECALVKPSAPANRLAIYRINPNSSGQLDLNRTTLTSPESRCLLHTPGISAQPPEIRAQAESNLLDIFGLFVQRS